MKLLVGCEMLLCRVQTYQRNLGLQEKILVKGKEEPPLYPLGL